MYLRATIVTIIAMASISVFAQYQERFGAGGIDNRGGGYYNPPPVLRPPHQGPYGHGHGYRPRPPMSNVATYCDAKFRFPNPRFMKFCAPTGFHLGGVVAEQAWNNARGRYSIFNQPRGYSCACFWPNNKPEYGISR